MTWTTLPEPSIVRDRHEAGFVTYPDGSNGIMLAGGYDETSTEFLDLQTLTWEPKHSLPLDIYYAASVPFKDSFLIVGGHHYNANDYLKSIYYYNPATDKWDFLRDMSRSREEFTAFMVPDSFANCV